MARQEAEGNVKVYWLTTVANIAAPTTAEIGAGKNLTPFLTKDGVDFGPTQNGVDTAGIDSNIDTQVGGSVGLQPKLTMFRDSTSETNGWDLMVPGTEGYVLITRFGSVAAGQKAEVYPTEMGIPQMAPPAANTAQRFVMPFWLRAAYNVKAVIA